MDAGQIAGVVGMKPELVKTGGFEIIRPAGIVCRPWRGCGNHLVTNGGPQKIMHM
jgi:hypothetical protein